MTWETQRSWQHLLNTFFVHMNNKFIVFPIKFLSSLQSSINKTIWSALSYCSGIFLYALCSTNCISLACGICSLGSLEKKDLQKYKTFTSSRLSHHLVFYPEMRLLCYFIWGGSHPLNICSTAFPKEFFLETRKYKWHLN